MFYRAEGVRNEAGRKTRHARSQAEHNLILVRRAKKKQKKRNIQSTKHVGRMDF